MERRLELFRAWRAGGALALAGGLALLGAAPSATPAALTAVSAGIAIALASECALRRTARAALLDPQLARLPEVTRARERLCSMRRRRTYATALRTAAAPPRWARTNPLVLWRRAARIAPALIAVAEELDQPAIEVEASVMLELERLLCDGRDSPLLNPDLPEQELGTQLTRIRFLLATASRPQPPQRKTPQRKAGPRATDRYDYR